MEQIAGSGRRKEAAGRPKDLEILPQLYTALYEQLRGPQNAADPGGPGVEETDHVNLQHDDVPMAVSPASPAAPSGPQLPRG